MFELREGMPVGKSVRRVIAAKNIATAPTVPALELGHESSRPRLMPTSPESAHLLEEPEDWEETVEVSRRKQHSGTRLDENMVASPKTQPKAKSHTAVKEKTDKVSTKSLSKKEVKLAVTGLEAEFPAVAMTRSYDPVYNMSWILHGRLAVHKWKQLMWMLRAKNAMESLETVGSGIPAGWQ